MKKGEENIDEYKYGESINRLNRGDVGNNTVLISDDQIIISDADANADADF